MKKVPLFLKNSFISFIFLFFPILSALVFIPLNISHLGLSLWGAYNLSISFFFIVMYFNIGIGPSVNRLIAKYIAKGEAKEELHIVHSGFFINLLITIVLISLILIFQNIIIEYSFKKNISSIELNEIKKLFFWTSISSGIYLLISYFRNVLEGRQLFFFVSLSRAVIGSFIIGAPLLSNSNNLSESGFYIFLMLSCILIGYTFYFTRFYDLPKVKLISVKWVKNIINHGILISLHSFINPVFIYFDRFLIGNKLGVDIVGIYTSFYDVISRTTIVPSSISGGLFPAVAAVSDSIIKSKKILIKALIVNFIISLLPLTVIFFFGYDLLILWLGKEISFSYSYVIIIISFSYFFQGFNLIFLRYLQGIGILKFSLYLNILLFIIYIPLLFFSINEYGILGVAITFLIKNILELTFNFYKVNNI